MENAQVSKTTAAFGISLAVCAVLNAAIVMVKEKSHGAMAWMQRATGHHWISHSAIVVGLFFILGGFFGAVLKGQGRGLSTGRLIGIVMAGVVVGCLAIVGFYAFVD